MLVTKTSTFTQKEHTLEIPVTPEQIAAWEGGELIQHAMPNLTGPEREFLITGTTQEEWDNVFGTEETTPWRS